MHSWFKNWFNSPYYHQLYIDRDEEEAALFIDKLADHLKPKENARMLDVACGKGRHAMQLASKGFDVTGIDLSEESINEALKGESDTLHFYVHDMRFPFWINYFDYTFNFFTSFGYFKTCREHKNAIRTLTQSLKPKGILVMDYLNVQYAVDNLLPVDDKEINGVHFIIKKWHDETHFYKKIIVEDKALKEPLIYTEKVAKFSLADFSDMYAKEGIEIKEVFGDYAFSDYTINKSPRLIMIGEKK